jgi:aldehyde dehydrogenase (NAD+)
MAQEFWLAGRRASGQQEIDVRHPYDGHQVGRVSVPTAAQVEQAVAAAAEVAPEFARLPAHVRADALSHVRQRIAERAEEFAALITAENGKPIRWARGEVDRAIATFQFAAEEARRFSGEAQRLDTEPAGAGRFALTRRFPRGPVLGIAPFNFPLNLVAHKVAPALAIGAPILIKPAPATPLTALALGEVLAETDLPAGSWSVLPVPNEQMPGLVADERLPVISFTGSGPVGWQIAAQVPRKHVTLELGGNAGVLVCADFAGEEDLSFAANRIAAYANYQGGQSCVSVQRVFADRVLYDRLVERVVAATAAQRTGDPALDTTDVGPLINEQAAIRVADWVNEAADRGAKVLVGGERTGASYAPTVLVDVPPEATVACEEVFGPVVILSPVDGVDDGLRAINDSRFGLQAGVFTRDLRVAFQAHRDLEVGGVIIGDVPSYRADQMPYGGTKESGVGREGVRYAMEDLSYERVMVFTGVTL